jgi:hypothetical protein
LVEVTRDPGWLEAADTIGVEAVQGSIKGEELRSEMVEKVYLVFRERKWCDGNTPGRCGCGYFGG